MLTLALSGLLFNFREAVSCRSELSMQAFSDCDDPQAWHQMLMSY